MCFLSWLINRLCLLPFIWLQCFLFSIAYTIVTVYHLAILDISHFTQQNLPIFILIVYFKFDTDIHLSIFLLGIQQLNTFLDEQLVLLHRIHQKIQNTWCQHLPSITHVPFRSYSPPNRSSTLSCPQGSSAVCPMAPPHHMKCLLTTTWLYLLDFVIPKTWFWLCTCLLRCSIADEKSSGSADRKFWYEASWVAAF